MKQVQRENNHNTRMPSGTMMFTYGGATVADSAAKYAARWRSRRHTARRRAAARIMSAAIIIALRKDTATPRTRKVVVAQPAVAPL